MSVPPEDWDFRLGAFWSWKVRTAKVSGAALHASILRHECEGNHLEWRLEALRYCSLYVIETNEKLLSWDVGMPLNEGDSVSAEASAAQELAKFGVPLLNHKRVGDQLVPLPS